VQPQEAAGDSFGHASGEQTIESDKRLAKLSFVAALLIGSAQILALAAGVSRSGVTMIAGLLRGLSNEDAARFAFLLATPVILAAGALKIPELFKPEYSDIHGQIIVGSLLSFIGAYVSLRFLTKYFETRTLTPFAIYCTAFGVGSLIYLNLS
jgi:undecaprenyl-diphosphatase